MQYCPQYDFSDVRIYTGTGGEQHESCHDNTREQVRGTARRMTDLEEQKRSSTRFLSMCVDRFLLEGSLEDEHGKHSAHELFEAMRGGTPTF